LLNEKDVPILKSLRDIKLSYIGDSKKSFGFQIDFIFNPNEFIESTALWKRIEFFPGGLFSYEIQQSGILWKPGKRVGGPLPTQEQVPVKTVAVKRKHDEITPDSSFFTFFEVVKNDDKEILEVFKNEILVNPLAFWPDVPETN